MRLWDPIHIIFEICKSLDKSLNIGSITSRHQQEMVINEWKELKDAKLQFDWLGIVLRILIGQL